MNHGFESNRFELKVSNISKLASTMKTRNMEIRWNELEFCLRNLDSKEKKFDILSDIGIGLGSGKELCMQCNPSKF
jgi:hypothetical protein